MPLNLADDLFDFEGSPPAVHSTSPQPLRSLARADAAAATAVPETSPQSAAPARRARSRHADVERGPPSPSGVVPPASTSAPSLPASLLEAGSRQQQGVTKRASGVQQEIVCRPFLSQRDGPPHLAAGRLPLFLSTTMVAAFAADFFGHPGGISDRFVFIILPLGREMGREEADALCGVLRTATVPATGASSVPPPPSGDADAASRLVGPPPRTSAPIVLNAGSPIDCDTALRLLADATPARPATVIAITPAASDAALRALAETVPRVSETPARMALVRAALYEGASSTTAVPTPVSTPAAPAAVTVLVRRLVGILNEQQHHHSGRDDDAAAPVQPRRVIFVLPEWVPASVEAAAQAIAAGSAPALAVVTQTGARAGLRAAVPLRKTPLDVAARLGEEPARKPPRPTVDELGDSVSPTNAKRKSEQAAAGGYLPLFFPTVAAGSAAAAGSEARASPSRPVTPVSDNGGSTSRRLRPFSASLAAAHAAAVRDADRAEQEAAPPVVSAAPLEWSAPPEVVVPRALVDVAAKSPQMAVEAAPIAAVAHSPFLSAAQQRTVAYLDRTQFFACQRAAPTNTTTEQYVGTSAPREGSWLVRALSTAPHATSASTSSGPPTALAGGRAISVAETDFGSLRAASSVHLEPGSPVKIGDRSSRANRTRDDDVFAVPEPPGAARDDDEAADDDAEAMAHLESVLHGRPAAGSPASIPWMPSESPAPRHPGDSAPLVNWPPPREPASTVPDGWHPILLGGSLLQGYDPTAHSARSAASSTSAGSSSSSAGGKLNAHLIKELGELHRIYQSTGDHWREYSYRRAMAVLAKFPVEITDAHKQLADVRGIGDKIRLKIAEILERGTSRKLEALKARPEVAGLDVLTNIFGVGPATAKKLMGLGVYSIDALRTNAAALATLTAPQQLGVRHYEDLLERIPRGEVTRIQNVVVRALEHLGYNVRVADEWNDPTDAAASSVSGRAEAGGLQTGGEPAPVGAATAPSTLTTMAATRRTSASRSRHGGRRGVVDVVTCGSYRRGKASSGDVDILVCERSGSYGDALLPFILDALRHDTAAQGGGGDAGKLEGDDHYDLFETLTAHGDSGTAHGSSTSAMVAAAAGSAARGEVHDSRTWLGVVRLAPNAARPLQDDAPPVELDRPTANRVRRLDIKCYDPESFPFAVLYGIGLLQSVDALVRVETGLLLVRSQPAAGGAGAGAAAGSWRQQRWRRRARRPAGCVRHGTRHFCRTGAAVPHASRAGSGIVNSTGFSPSSFCFRSVCVCILSQLHHTRLAFEHFARSRFAFCRTRRTVTATFHFDLFYRCIFVVFTLFSLAPARFACALCRIFC